MSDEYGDVLRFHGHECPGAAVGLRMAQVAVSRFGRNTPSNKIVAVSENDTCSADAVQVVTGCTFGTRTFIHQDHGKNAVTFWRLADGAGVRVAAKPGSDAFRSPEIWALARKVDDGTATDAEQRQFSELQAARIKRILAAEASDILVTEEVGTEAPAHKKLSPYDTCQNCGDLTSVAILHNHRGRMLCVTCHTDAHGGTLPAEHGHHHHHDHPDHQHTH